MRCVAVWVCMPGFYLVIIFWGGSMADKDSTVWAFVTSQL